MVYKLRVKTDMHHFLRRFVHTATKSEPAQRCLKVGITNTAFSRQYASSDRSCETNIEPHSKRTVRD